MKGISMSKLQGLAKLVQDAVDKSATAIEDVHLKVANEPLNILKKIPPLTAPATGLQKILNLCITSAYEIIRTVNRETGNMVNLALEKVEKLTQSCPHDEEGQP
jgi:hypothetical protein